MMHHRFGSLAALLPLVAACAPAPHARSVEAAPQTTVAVPPSSAAGAEPVSEPPPPDPPWADEVVGIPECDRYLASYRDCAATLAPDVAAGTRRAYASERAWLLHVKSSSEAPNLPAACDDMMRELERVCPGSKH